MTIKEQVAGGKTTRFPWLGNKKGTPRLRGAAKAHRESQLDTSAYGKIPLKSLMGRSAVPKSPPMPAPATFPKFPRF